MEDLETRYRRQRDHAIEIATKHKAREERIVRGLGAVQEALACDNLKRASLAIDSLMQTDLKEARASVYNHDFALKIAVTTLQRQGDALVRGTEVAKTLGQIRQLAPKAFDESTLSSGPGRA